MFVKTSRTWRLVYLVPQCLEYIQHAWFDLLCVLFPMLPVSVEYEFGLLLNISNLYISF